MSAAVCAICRGIVHSFCVNLSLFEIRTEHPYTVVTTVTTADRGVTMPPFSDEVDVVLPIVTTTLHDRSDSNTTVDDALKEGDEITSALLNRPHGDYLPISPPPKRQVHICPFATTYYIETLDEYTDEEMDACWYNDDETAAIKANNLRTIREEASGRLRPEMDTIRGLESQKHQGYMSLRTLRESSISAVLAEQSRQRQRGKTDPQLIRDCYGCISIRASSRARELAQVDALEALRVQKDSLTWHLLQIEDTTRECCFFIPPVLWFQKHRSTGNAMVDL